ncbi:unnamed protein product [Calypogeia fissa]
MFGTSIGNGALHRGVKKRFGFVGWKGQGGIVDLALNCSSVLRLISPPSTSLDLAGRCGGDGHLQLCQALGPSLGFWSEQGSPSLLETASFSPGNLSYSAAKDCGRQMGFIFCKPFSVVGSQIRKDKCQIPGLHTQEDTGTTLAEWQVESGMGGSRASCS